MAGASIARAGGELDAWPFKLSEPDEHYAEFLLRLERIRDRLLPAPNAGNPAKAARASDSLDGMDAGWVQGCSRTLWMLRARQSEPGAREFLRRLRVLFQRVQHPLRRELSAGRFPPLSPAVVVDVESREPWIGF